ncbi:MAG: hypothetical protein AB2770_06545 [Candidatus Thiodiazotropha taylori]
MNWEEYLTEIKKWDLVKIEPKGFVVLECVTPVTPKEYLEYADKDLLLDGAHGNVNALSNAKRAIDCQITNLLSVLGLSVSGNIHKKIERIKDIGILAPRILKKVNKIRNLLEHEFQAPTEEEAENAVDIAMLFIGATEKVFTNFMYSFWVARDGSENRASIYKDGNKTLIIDNGVPDPTFSDGLYIQYDKDSRDYGLWGYIENEEIFVSVVKRGSPLHVTLLHYSTLNHYSGMENEANLAGIDFVGSVKDKSGISV